MKFTATVAAVVLILSCAARQARAQDPQDSAEKQVTATLRAMYEAEKRKDLAFVLAHLSDDFTEVAGDGLIYHRDDIQREWQSVALRNYSLEDCVFKALAADTSLLSCRMQVDATYKGQAFPAVFRVTTVWTRTAGAWKIRFEQGTVIPDKK